MNEVSDIQNECTDKESSYFISFLGSSSKIFGASKIPPEKNWVRKKKKQTSRHQINNETYEYQL
jgi:hypothetical protein